MGQLRESNGKEKISGSLPLKNSVDRKPGSYIAALKIPDTYTSDFVAQYGELKKKPKDVKVDYRTARNAMKAIF